MAEDREYSNIYTIPPNYTDSGKLLGGMLETRNTVEAGILLALIGDPELCTLSSHSWVKRASTESMTAILSSIIT